MSKRRCHGLVGRAQSQALEVRNVEYALVLGVDQAGIVHEQCKDLVVLELGGEGSILVESPQRLGALQRAWHDEGKLDDRASWETIAFGSAQAECDVHFSVLHVARLLGHFAERGGAVMGFDLDLPAGLALELFAHGSTTSN